MKPIHKTAINEKALIQKLSQVLATLNTTKEVQQFLEDLCTPAELQAMADRWRVVDLIETGKSYRQIYEETGVSMTTITRVARCLRFGTGYQLARCKESL